LEEEPDACRVIMENPGIKSYRLAEVLGVSQRKMERLLRQLKKTMPSSFGALQKRVVIF
jgi:predicted oxidoreductase (fatty acid repression mutant protein)